MRTAELALTDIKFGQCVNIFIRMFPLANGELYSCQLHLIPQFYSKAVCELITFPHSNGRQHILRMFRVVEPSRGYSPHPSKQHGLFTEHCPFPGPKEYPLQRRPGLFYCQLLLHNQGHHGARSSSAPLLQNNTLL